VSLSVPFLALSAQETHKPLAQLSLPQSPSSAHPCPSGQGPQAPPQSMPVSVPLRRSSLHEVQIPPAQVLLAQSALIAQSSPSGQRGQPPPQSVSVSLPFSASSVHETHLPPSQVSLAQSASARHVSPSSQRRHVGSIPPQSTSDSVPLSARSRQNGTGWQVTLQMPLAHCALAVHPRPTGHRPQLATLPQSCAGSLPLATPSLQDGAWQHVSVSASHPPARQTPLSQSVASSHAMPVPQVASHGPPQSIPVSP
jgi:hypothetical protein